MVRVILAAIVYCVYMTCPVNADDHYASMLSGWEGLRELTNVQKWQEELEISPDQQLAMQALLKDNRLVRSVESVRRERRGLDGAINLTAVRDQSQLELIARDKFVRPEFEKILFPQQFERWRELYLRKRFVAPYTVFDEVVGTKFLKELELSDREIAVIQKPVLAAQLELLKVLEGERRKAVGEVLAELTEQQQEKFSHLFGPELVPTKVNASRPVVAEIEVLAESQPRQQIWRALPKTSEQSVQLAQLLRRENIEEAQNPGAGQSARISEALDKILGPEERIEVVQRIHRDNLQLKFANLLRAEFVKYMELDRDVLDRITPLIMRWDESIRVQQKAGEFEIYELGLAALPDGQRVRVSKLFEGVWER